MFPKKVAEFPSSALRLPTPLQRAVHYELLRALQARVWSLSRMIYLAFLSIKLWKKHRRSGGGAEGEGPGAGEEMTHKYSYIC